MLKTAIAAATATLLSLTFIQPAAASGSLNGVNMNGLNLNGIKLNGLRSNGVNMNGPALGIGFVIDGITLPLAR